MKIVQKNEGTWKLKMTVIQATKKRVGNLKINMHLLILCKLTVLAIFFSFTSRAGIKIPFNLSTANTIDFYSLFLYLRKEQ